MNKLCECGCGQELSPKPYKGRYRRFIHGHNGKKERNGNWHGGRHQSNGYILIRKTDHPKTDCRGYVPEHILTAEKALGKLLPQGGVVHHVNENRRDNHGSNLVICPGKSYHALLHRRTKALKETGNPNALKCSFCKQWDDSKNMKQVVKNGGPRGAFHLSCKQRYHAEWLRRQK